MTLSYKPIGIWRREEFDGQKEGAIVDIYNIGKSGIYLGQLVVETSKKCKSGACCCIYRVAPAVIYPEGKNQISMERIWSLRRPDKKSGIDRFSEEDYVSFIQPIPKTDPLCGIAKNLVIGTASLEIIDNQDEKYPYYNQLLKEARLY